MVRHVLIDPPKKKSPAIERVYEEPEIEQQSDDFGIPTISSPCYSTPSPPPQSQIKVEESPILPFSNEDLMRLKEAVKMVKDHGIAI